MRRQRCAARLLQPPEIFAAFPALASGGRAGEAGGRPVISNYEATAPDALRIGHFRPMAAVGVSLG